MRLEAIMVWLLASLLAISVVVTFPLLGLAIAGVGGACAGALLALGEMRRHIPKR